MEDKSLYGYQIRNALGGIVDLFGAEAVPDIEGPVVAVCNTDVSGGEGKHWVAICIDRYGRGEFFDSLGMHPIAYGFEQHMDNKCKTWTYNDIRLQDLTSVACGYYVIGYSMFKINGFSMETFVSMFSKNTIDNDELIMNWILGNDIV